MGEQSWEEHTLLLWLNKVLNARKQSAGQETGEEDIFRSLVLKALYHARRKIAKVRTMGVEPPAADWIDQALIAIFEAQESYDESEGASMSTWADRRIHFALETAERNFFKEIASPEIWLWQRVAYLKTLFRLEGFSIPGERQLQGAGLDADAARFVHDAVAAIKTRNRRIKEGGPSFVGHKVRFGIAPPFEELGQGFARACLHSLRPIACYKILKEKTLQSRDYEPLSEKCVLLDTPPLDDGESRDTLAFYRALQKKSVSLHIVPTRDDLAETDVFIDGEEAERFCQIRKEIATMPSAEYLAKSDRMDVEVARNFLMKWVPHRRQSCGFPSVEPWQAQESHDDDASDGSTSQEIVDHSQLHVRLELRDIINNCLAKIRPEHRKLLEEHLEGATAKELAEKYREPVRRIETRVRRSRAEFKGCMEYYLSDEDILLINKKLVLNIQRTRHPVYIDVFNNKVTVSHDIGEIPCVLIYDGKEHMASMRDKSDRSGFFVHTFKCQMPPIKYIIQAVISKDDSSLTITLINRT